MTKPLKQLLLIIFAVYTVLSCKQQSKEEAQEQFRERQQAIFERAEVNSGGQDETASSTDKITIEQLPATVSEKDKPTSTAGDKVVAIKDGDTIELLQNGQPVTVRLYGVDTPEKNQDYGQRAKQFTSDLVFSKSVRLIAHNKDRYGRTVGTIILPDGRSLNEELVRNGYAWHYKAYSTDQNLANLEVDARRFKRGLWQDPNPTAPWDFRKNKRSGDSLSTTSTMAKAPVPAGATKRAVYLCNSSGSAVYHVKVNCSVLKRCKAEVLTVTEAEAIRQYGRRADKTCSK
ncbi:thermonuclease family protein [Pontibacter silvestris]|uniref:Thermonuclease family protein n=1 Tax=Pontibacter silvestris TaxID=2305183 RepID=A0ABW4WZ30_9BACT|nr:thermonuclease family protein [Pontibacter silvestris]MCC9135444.1 thermonuclease family protein [Pontibacter silvestris]